VAGERLKMQEAQNHLVKLETYLADLARE